MKGKYIREEDIFIKDVWEIHQDLKLAMKNQSWEEALEHIESLLAVEPSKEYWVSKGFILTKMKRYEESIGSYEEALSYDPYNESINYNLGYSQMMLEMFEDALKTFNTILEVNPSHEYALKARKMCVRAISRTRVNKT